MRRWRKETIEKDRDSLCVPVTCNHKIIAHLSNLGCYSFVYCVNRAHWSLHVIAASNGEVWECLFHCGGKLCHSSSTELVHVGWGSFSLPCLHVPGIYSILLREAFYETCYMKLGQFLIFSPSCTRRCITEGAVWSLPGRLFWILLSSQATHKNYVEMPAQSAVLWCGTCLNLSK